MAHEMNGADAFERAVKNSMESYELPFNSADWNELERELGSTSGTTRNSTAALIALLFGGSLALFTTVYLMVNQEPLAGNGNGASIAALVEPTPDEVTNDQSDPQDADMQDVPTNTSSAERTIRTAIVTAHRNGSEAFTNRSGNDPTPKVTGAIVPANTAIAIRSSITEGCPGSVVEFNVVNAPDSKDVLWNFGDGNFSTAKNPSHVFAKPGRFEVVLSHSSFLDKPVSGVIVIHELPDATFNPMPQTYANTIPHIHFENQSLGGSSYVWDFGDGSTSTIRYPNHVYKQAGTYSVSLLVTNPVGCTDRTERTVRVEEDYNLLAAKTFSPNSDGVEDNFIPEALKTLDLRFRMTVHNPVTGQLIFETTDAKRPWNGRVGGRGEACADGNYVWMVEMKDGEKVGGTYTGTISLVR